MLKRILLLTLSLLICAASALATEIPFTRVDIDASLDGAGGVIVGDLDGDGDDDVVAAAIFGDEVVWYENSSGDGTTWVKNTIDASLEYAYNLDLADVNGDGALDVLVTGNAADEVAWYENDLDGAATWPKTLIAALDDPWGVRAADIDHDGDLDVVTASDAENLLVWYENLAGDGSTWGPVTIDSNFLGANWASVGDVDQDGTLDVLSTGYDGDEAAWFANTAGDGTTWTKTTISTGLDDIFAAELGDLDGDGDLDATATASGDDEILWFENTDGVGGAWTETTIDAVADKPEFVEVRDVDQDGDLDILAAATNSDETMVYENDGASFTKRAVQGSFDGALGAAGGDIDGDGDIDLATVAIYDDDVVFMRNDSVHSTSQGFAKTAMNYGTSDARHTTVVDVDQDGDLDVLGGANSGIAWSQNLLGDATSWQNSTIDSSARYWSTGAADLDGDGNLDLLGGDMDNGELAWFVNDGSGNYTRTVIGSGLGITRDIDTADMDGDGDLDVVVSSQGSARLVWYANDDGVGGSWTEAVVASRAGPYGVEIVDFDQNGTPNILCAWDNGDRVSWFANDGAGTFSETVLATPDGPRWARAADYDEDGDLDVLVAVAADGDVIILVNPGSAGGAFTTEVVDDTLTNGWFAEWADLDLDGDLDIAASAGDQVNIYENTAAGWVKTTVDTGSNILHGDLGDLDGDGDLDVVAPHLSGTDGFYWYPNNRVHAESTSTDVSPSTPQAGSGEVLLQEIAVSHLGRIGDSGIEPTTLAIAFDDTSGTPLTQATIELIVAQLDVLADTNANGCEVTDTSVGTLSSFPVTDGVITIPLTSGIAAVAAEDTATWCTRITLTAVPVSGGLAQIVVSHVPDEGDVFSDNLGGIDLVWTGTGVSSTVVVNEPPVADGGGPYTVDEGVAIALDGSASSDTDGTVVDWSWDCDGDGTGDATGATPSCTFDDDGVYAVGLTVTDDLGTSGSGTATVTVSNVAPTLTVSPPAAVAEGGTQSWSALTSDVSGDTVTVSWVVQDPSGATFSSGSGSTLSVTYPDDGTWTIVFTASDEDGGTTSDTQTTSVINVQPVSSIDSGPSTANEGDTVVFIGSATDAGSSDTFTLAWELLDGASASVTTGAGVSFSPTLPNDDTYTVVLTATDDDGGFDSATAAITSANVAPSITSTPTTSLNEGVAWQYLPTVSDPGADTLAFTASAAAPSGMGVSGSTGQLDWTPTYADGSSASFDLTVEDGDGGTDTQSITLTIAFLDSEPDGMADGWESANSLDPTVDDSAGDPDADGLSNLDEFLDGTDPQSYDGPDVPVATFPLGGEELDDATPTFTWTNATDPQGQTLTYEVEVYDDASMSTLLDTTTGVTEDASGTTSWTSTLAVTENTTAWWRVRAADSAVAGGWTDLEEFFVNETNEAPIAPAPASPLEGDSVDSTTPVLTWTEGSDVDLDVLTYDIEVVDGTMTLVTQAQGISGLTWTVDTELTEDAWYSWEARSVDPDGLTSDWTAGQAFFVDTANAAPADVVWISPLDGDELTDVSPELEVSESSDPESEALAYTFEIDTASTFDTADFDTADSLDPTWDLFVDGVSLTDNVTWYLRARVTDARGAASDWAQIEVFVRGENDGPAPPVLIAPVDGLSQLTTAPVPTFVVGHALDPEGDDVVYAVRLARDEALTDIVEEVTGLAPSSGSEGTADQTSWTLSAGLTAGDYFWSAAAVDEEGASTDADEVWGFTIEEPSVGDDDDDDDDDTGCDCQSSLADGPSPSLWMLLLLVPALRRRR